MALVSRYPLPYNLIVYHVSNPSLFYQIFSVLFYVENKMPILRCDMEESNEGPQSHHMVKHDHEAQVRCDVG
jgi:hypothetical protein